LVVSLLFQFGLFQICSNFYSISTKWDRKPNLDTHSDTGGPRHNIPLYSLVLRQNPPQIRPVGSQYRGIHCRTISAPLTPTASTPCLPSPPYSHSLTLKKNKNTRVQINSPVQNQKYEHVSF
jgi:hypothetical protein